MYPDGAVFHLDGEEWKEITVTSGNFGNGVEGGGVLLCYTGYDFSRDLF